MKEPTKHKLLPPNPLRRVESLDPLIVGKQVFRLMMQDPSFPAYRDVHITTTLIELVLEHEHHLATVAAIQEQIENQSTVNWQEVEPYRPESELIIDIVIRLLKEKYPNGIARLTHQLTADIIEAVHAIHYKLFLMEEVATKPSNALEYHNRGHAFRLLGQPEEALRDYSMAISMEPSNPLFLYSRASCLFKMKNDAVRSFMDVESAISLSRNSVRSLNIDLFFLRSRVQHAMHHDREAIASLRASIELIRFFIHDVKWDALGYGRIGSDDFTNIVFIADVLHAMIDFVSSYKQQSAQPVLHDISKDLLELKSTLA